MSIEAKKKWITSVQIGATIAGAITVIALRLYGVRFFFKYVPTFIVLWIPIFVGTFAVAKIEHASRRRWIAWSIGLTLMIVATVYAAVGETPSVLIPPMR